MDYLRCRMDRDLEDVLQEIRYLDKTLKRLDFAEKIFWTLIFLMIWPVLIFGMD